MAGSDPAGRPLRARLGHRQRPQGPSHFWDRSHSPQDRHRIAATPGTPSESRPPAGISVGVVVLAHVRLWLAEAPGAAVDN